MTTREMVGVLLGNVRAEMARAKVSQTRAAIALGISQAQMSERMNGVVDFRVHELLVLAQLTQVPPSRFLDGLDVELPRLDSNQEPAGYLPSAFAFYHRDPKSGVNLPPVPADRTSPKAA